MMRRFKALRLFVFAVLGLAALFVGVRLFGEVRRQDRAAGKSGIAPEPGRRRWSRGGILASPPVIVALASLLAAGAASGLMTYLVLTDNWQTQNPARAITWLLLCDFIVVLSLGTIIARRFCY